MARMSSLRVAVAVAMASASVAPNPNATTKVTDFSRFLLFLSSRSMQPSWATFPSCATSYVQSMAPLLARSARPSETPTKPLDTLGPLPVRTHGRDIPRAEARAPCDATNSVRPRYPCVRDVSPPLELSRDCLLYTSDAAD